MQIIVSLNVLILEIVIVVVVVVVHWVIMVRGHVVRSRVPYPNMTQQMVRPSCRERALVTLEVFIVALVFSPCTPLNHDVTGCTVTHAMGGVVAPRTRNN